jgi:hypothetical protein
MRGLPPSRVSENFFQLLDPRVLTLLLESAVEID